MNYIYCIADWEQTVFNHQEERLADQWCERQVNQFGSQSAAYFKSVEDVHNNNPVKVYRED